MPVDDTDESGSNAPPVPRKRTEYAQGEPPTLVPDSENPDGPMPGSDPVVATFSEGVLGEQTDSSVPMASISSERTDSGPTIASEREVTAIALAPSGPSHSPAAQPSIMRSGSSPFTPDGSPTLTPLIESDPNERYMRRPEISPKEDAEETKETPHGRN
jgi:hypothetical protein